jgi:hypothetical protein
MTKPDAVRDDIAFLRNMAEAGREGPLTGGAILLAGGGIFGVASLAVSYGLSSGLGWGGWMQYIWPLSAAAFFAVLIGVRLRQRREVAGPAARAAGFAWAGLGMAMFFIMLSLILVAVRLRDAHVLAAVGPIFLALYGGGWFVAHLAAKRVWLQGVSVGAFMMSGVTALMADNLSRQFLAYGLALILLVALPGLVLMSAARKSAAPRHG